MIQQVLRDGTWTRDKTCADVAGGLSLRGIEMLATIVWTVLRGAGSKKIKLTRKTGLTREMKKQRSSILDVGRIAKNLLRTGFEGSGDCRFFFLF